MSRKKDIPSQIEGDEKTLKLDYKQTFKVGLAFATICLFWQAYDFVIPLLLENAYGLSNALRGLIMGLDNLLSLFMLPLFGKLSDKANGKLVKRFGRRTPFILIGTICAVILMVFVPVATLNQQKAATNLSNDVEARFHADVAGDEYGATTLLTKWYDDAENKVKGSANYCDLKYLEQNKKDYEGQSVKEFFTSIRFDDKLTSKKAVLNFIGATTYYYDGEVIETEEVDGKTVLIGTAPNGRTFEEIKTDNAMYKKYVASGLNTFISDTVFEQITTTKAGQSSLAVYMVILLLVLIAMATFRSPAVALMPDVTPKPLRSQANAVINLMGGIGGAIAFLIYTIAFFDEKVSTFVIIFASAAAGMLLLLAGFIAFVNEKKMVAKCQELCKEYGIDDFDAEENPDTATFAEELIYEGEGNDEMATMLDNKLSQNKRERMSPKEWWGAKSNEEKAKLKSFWLILASIFMWFMGYNAISSNLSVYTTKALNLSAGIASIISGISMAISAIAFIPVGYLAAKIGRRKTIMIGFLLAVVSFLLIFLFVEPNDNAAIPSALFALFYLISGFGLIIANVNTFPMVTELSTAGTVGQYTGYYYTATMSAQAITPALGGLVMDKISNEGLFVYSAICIIIAIGLMAFVKHGDSKPIPKKNKMEQYGDMMDAD